jgi:molybdenum cofactor cytidylyltransferase
MEWRAHPAHLFKVGIHGAARFSDTSSPRCGSHGASESGESGGALTSGPVLATGNEALRRFPSSMTTSAILLSGGASQRFGGFPKALLSTGEKTAVRRLAEVCLAGGFDPVVVVTGTHHLQIAHEVRGLDVEVVEAKDWYEGRTASVQAGLRAIPEDRDILLWPVDHPFVDPRTLETLEAVRGTDQMALWFIPTYHGRGGHPVLWRPSLRTDLLDLRSDAPLRSLLPEFGPQVRHVDVEDAGVVANVDTPEAYRAAYDDWRSQGGP